MQKDLWDFLGSDEAKPMLRKPRTNSMDRILNEVFLKPDDTNLVQQQEEQPRGAVSAKSYNSRSGQIFGVLKQMQETFEKNLTTAQAEEKAARESFAALKAAKTKEINAAASAKDDKTSELATTDQRNAQAKEDIENTKAALSADERFQVELEERCATSDKEFAERQKTRAEEIQAVSETISFLTDEDARDLFSRTLSFAQIANSGRKKLIREATAKLLQVAKKNHDYHLAHLAVAVKLDAFTRVKKAMDDMVEQLKKEQKDEVDHRDWCLRELDQNEDQLADKNRKKANLEAAITDLEGTLDTLKNDVEALNGEIAELQTQMKRAGEDRGAENKEFQTTVSDQRATVQILNKALARLQKFYNKKSDALVQAAEPGKSVAGEAPKQATYKKSGGAPGVLGLIQMIINDAERMTQEALSNEQASQKAYESFVQNTNASIRANQEEIASKLNAKADADLDKAEAGEELRGTVATLENLSGYNGQMHRSCDWVVKNFETRQTARQEEIDAIGEAKAILSGSDFGSD